MKAVFILASLFIVSCRQPENKRFNYPTVIFNKGTLSLYTKPNNFSFKFIRVTKKFGQKSIFFEFADSSVTNFSFRDSILSKWSITDKSILDTLDYNIQIKINSKDIYGFNMDFGYINRRDNSDSIIILKPLLNLKIIT